MRCNVLSHSLCTDSQNTRYNTQIRIQDVYAAAHQPVIEVQRRQVVDRGRHVRQQRSQQSHEPTAASTGSCAAAAAAAAGVAAGSAGDHSAAAAWAGGAAGAGQCGGGAGLQAALPAVVLRSAERLGERACSTQVANGQSSNKWPCLEGAAKCKPRSVRSSHTGLSVALEYNASP